VYHRTRYLTLTERRFASKPIAFRQRELEAIQESLAPAGEPLASAPSCSPTGSASKADDDILQKMFSSSKTGDKARRLFAGDRLGFPTPSERDYSLASELGYWTRWDLDRVEALMRRSGCVRPKWDSPRGGKNWLRATIERAYASRKTDGRPLARIVSTGGLVLPRLRNLFRRPSPRLRSISASRSGSSTSRTPHPIGWFPTCS
jgi:hypothetical protein